MTLHNPIEAIQAHLDEWDVAFVEQDVFGTTSAAEIAAITDRFCLSHLGSRLSGTLFYQSSVGSTHGLALADGRRVVMKARPPPETNPDLPLDRRSLKTVAEIQTWLSDRSYPCPVPLVGPAPIGRGLATVETLLDRGGHGDGFDPACRKVIAGGLAQLISLLRGIEIDVSHLGHFMLQSRNRVALYPQPHGKLFDFERTAAGAEWIDAFARQARTLDTHEGEPVLGHCDWRVEHLRFEAGAIVATYDWDSLARRPETNIVATAAVGHTADWSRAGPRIPRLAEIEAFIADYEEARATRFSRRERTEIAASGLFHIAYGARCAHSLAPGTKEWPEDSWPYLLRAAGEALLGTAR